MASRDGGASWSSSSAGGAAHDLHSHPQAHVWLPKAEPGSPANIPPPPPQQSWPEVPGDTGLESPGSFVWVSFRGDFGNWRQDDQFSMRASDPEQTDDAPKKHVLIPLGYLVSSVPKRQTFLSSACLLLPHSPVQSVATMPYGLPLYPPHSSRLPSPLPTLLSPTLVSEDKLGPPPFQDQSLYFALGSQFPPFFLFSSHPVFCCVCLAALPP